MPLYPFTAPALMMTENGAQQCLIPMPKCCCTYVSQKQEIMVLNILQTLSLICVCRIIAFSVMLHLLTKSRRKSTFVTDSSKRNVGLSGKQSGITSLKHLTACSVKYAMKCYQILTISIGIFFPMIHCHLCPEFGHSEVSHPGKRSHLGQDLSTATSCKIDVSHFKK